MRPILLAMMLLAACDRDRPPAPTQEQSAQLNEAENMLDEAARNEKGPEQRPGPSNSSD